MFFKIEKLRISNVSMLFRNMGVSIKKFSLKYFKVCFWGEVEKFLGFFKVFEVFDFFIYVCI